MHLLSVLVMAVGVLGRILIDLGEFVAAKDLVEAVIAHVSTVIPKRRRQVMLMSLQALSLPDLLLRAELFDCLADAYAGIALRKGQSSAESGKHMRYAVDCIDRSCSCEYLFNLQANPAFFSYLGRCFGTSLIINSVRPSRRSFRHSAVLVEEEARGEMVW